MIRINQYINNKLFEEMRITFFPDIPGLVLKISDLKVLKYLNRSRGKLHLINGNDIIIQRTVY